MDAARLTNDEWIAGLIRSAGGRPEFANRKIELDRVTAALDRWKLAARPILFLSAPPDGTAALVARELLLAIDQTSKTAQRNAATGRILAAWLPAAVLQQMASTYTPAPELAERVTSRLDVQLLVLEGLGAEMSRLMIEREVSWLTQRSQRQLHTIVTTTVNRKVLASRWRDTPAVQVLELSSWSTVGGKK
jgi:hypothetical protein